MYECTFCGKPIKATVGDPVNVTSKGRFHSECMRLAYQRADQEEAQRRSEGQKRRWAKPEQPKQDVVNRRSEGQKRRWARIRGEQGVTPS